MKNMMKKNCLFLLAAFAAVILSLTACSSSDEADLTTPEQPTEPDADRGVVKTEFTISFPKKMVSGNRRLAGKAVQLSADDFRGITNMELYPFSKTTLEGTEQVNSRIALFDASAENEISDKEALYTNTNSRLYQDVDIPIGTKAFLFYGLAKETTGVDDDETDKAKVFGKLKHNTGATLDKFTFEPSPIVTNDAAIVTTNSALIEEYLTSIADAKVSTTKKWEDTNNVPLATLRDSLLSIRTGSWNNVKAIVNKIYSEVKTPKSYDSDDTKALKGAIKTAILNEETYGVTDANDDGVLEFGTKIGNYPADNGLPDGAAYIQWNGSKFEEKTDNITTGWNMAAFTKYAYPASLYYHVISGIRTSNKSESGLYGSSTYTNWESLVNAYADDNLTKDDVGNIAITKETRSVALVKQVQYAVGRLDVTIIADVSGGNIKDIENNAISLGANTFEVTGLLVGGQRAVDYKFNQIEGESEFMMYDSKIKTSEAAPVTLQTTRSKAFSTLVLESADAGQNDENKENAKVKIAVEFVNNSAKAFYGKGGHVIYPGCKFYLVGTIDPSTNSTIHYNLDSTKALIKKAFAQDHITTVNLTIKNLKEAYDTMPDLSLPQLELGLSVDLGWVTGVSYNIDIN